MLIPHRAIFKFMDVHTNLKILVLINFSEQGEF